MNPLTRRRFFNATAQAAALGALSACATSPFNTAGRSAIIDTHTHFYDPSRPQGVPWPSRDDKFLYRTVLPKDYRALPVPHPVAGTVIVEASPWIGDNQWILDLAANDPFIVGFVGNLPIGTDEFAVHLKRFSANKIFRGIRIAARQDDLANNSPLLRDLKLLADRDLSLDLLGGQGILNFAVRISERIPNLRIIIDHLAGVRIDGQTPPADWTAAMTAVAKKPNIACKLSGLVENTSHEIGSVPQNVEYYTPILDTMTQLFPSTRLIYASNWPVSERFAPLSTVQSLIENYFTTHTPKSLNDIFQISAKRGYKWQSRV
jgi:L-fuconolactonase